MDPVTLQLLLSGLQVGIGGLQRRSAAKRREKALDNLSYDIPDATLQQVELARERASRMGLPGEDITRSRIDSNMATTLSEGESVAETASDVLGLYGRMFARGADVEKEILEKGAAYKDQNELQLQRSLGLLSNAQEQQFYYNKFVPFLSEMGYAGDQSQGGAANIASGLQTAYNAWDNDWMLNMYRQMYGNSQSNSNQSGDYLSDIRNATTQKIKNNEDSWTNQILGEGGLNL